MLAALLSACSFGERPSRALHEAQATVTMADSLRAAGLIYNDSAQLAQAYAVLSKWQWIYPDEYVQACYHYGRLLREKDDPAAAMECFIHATHTRSRNYHILGRVYSNMGDISHLADDFQLSYDMFEHSANMYALAEDSMTYYYALYRMAYEKAELKDSTSCLLLLHEIPDIQELHEYVAMTLAEMYLRCCQYESAILYANRIDTFCYSFPICSLIKAQSYFWLDKTDSALIYANAVMEDSRSSFKDRFNALYIISHYDTTLCSNDIRELASQREDIRYYVYEPKKEKLSIAIQLLEQNLNQKVDLSWLYAILTTLFIGGGVIVFYIYKKRKRHQLLVQQIAELENRNEETLAQMSQQIDERCAVLSNTQNAKEILCWNDYNKMCRIIDQQFYFLTEKLHQSYSLSERETRLCILTLLNYGYDKMADMLIYAPNGIGKLKVRVAKKLGTSAKNLRQFLIDKVIKE